MTKLHDKKVAILVTNGFEQSELTDPRAALDEAGAETHIVSPEPREVKAWQHTDWGDTFDVTVSLGQADADTYAALVLPGGVMNPDHLRTNEDALDFVRAFARAEKPIACICHGAWTLIDAGLVKGRRMTSYHSIKTDVQNAGAHWVDEQVVRDGDLITSRNPDDLPAFCQALITALADD